MLVAEMARVLGRWLAAVHSGHQSLGTWPRHCERRGADWRETLCTCLYTQVGREAGVWLGWGAGGALSGGIGPRGGARARGGCGRQQPRGACSAGLSLRLAVAPVATKWRLGLRSAAGRPRVPAER
eukprot:725355-Prymnesium_polylepis.1